MNWQQRFYYLDFIAAPLASVLWCVMHDSTYGWDWWSYAVLCFGVLTWTLIEFGLHHLGHTLPSLQKEHFHHHREPIAITGPSSFITLALYLGIYLGLDWINAWFASAFMPGLLIGYAAYLWLHNAIHRGKLPRFLLERKQYHEDHHRGVREKFGVTTSLWDRVFKKKSKLP